MPKHNQNHVAKKSKKKSGAALTFGKRVPKGGDTPFTYVPMNSRRVQLTWSGFKSVTESAAGAGGQSFYKINSAYDVDSSVGSTSTPGFAEYSYFFSSYRVWAAEVMVIGSCAGGVSGSVATVVIYPSPTSVFLSSPASWTVAPLAVKKTIRADSTAGGSNLATLRKRYDFPTLLRISIPEFLNNFSYTASTTANPSTLVSLAVGVVGINSSTAVGFSYQIYVKMDVEFFFPVQLSV